MKTAGEAVDEWPADRTEIPNSVLESDDGKQRIRFWKRSDGNVQFERRLLKHDEDQGQRFSIWVPCYPPSGIFPDLNSARFAAARILQGDMS
jgi:hypothetical protein